MNVRFLSLLKPTAVTVAVFCSTVFLQLSLGVEEPYTSTDGLVEHTLWSSYLLRQAVSGFVTSVISGHGCFGMNDQYRIGVGVWLTVSENAWGQVVVHWRTVLFALALTYAVSSLLGWMVVRFGKVARPARLILTMICGCIICGFLVSICWSRVYWGYYLRRPGVDPRIRCWERVLSITPFTATAWVSSNTPPWEYVIERDYNVTTALKKAKTASEYPYYALRERILLHMDKHGILPSDAETMQLDRLSHILHQTPIESVWNGILVEGADRRNQRYLFLGHRPLVYNDHREYREYLYRLSDYGDTIREIAFQRFFFDSAGFEGMEWNVVFIALASLGMLVVLPLTIFGSLLPMTARSRFLPIVTFVVLFAAEMIVMFQHL